jgi:hypothetical protein
MLRMKLEGHSIAAIAEHFEMSPNSASKDLTRAIRKARDLEVQEAELWRHVQSERLEALLHAVMPDALTGEVRSVEQARKLIVDLTDLLGVKVPVRTEISGPDGGAIPFSSGELSELQALIDISDQEHADIPAFDHDEDDADEDEDEDDQDTADDDDDSDD